MGDYSLRICRIMICISQWLLVFGWFLLLKTTWPWPCSAGHSQAQCNYILVKLKKNLLETSVQDSSPGALASELLSAFNIHLFHSVFNWCLWKDSSYQNNYYPNSNYCLYPYWFTLISLNLGFSCLWTKIYTDSGSGTQNFSYLYFLSSS